MLRKYVHRDLREPESLIAAGRVIIAAGILLYAWLDAGDIRLFHILLFGAFVSNSALPYFVRNLIPKTGICAAQIFIDTVLMMPVLYLTGGVASPFIWIVFLILIEQELILPARMRAFLLPLYILVLFVGVPVLGLSSIPFLLFSLLTLLTILILERFRNLMDIERIASKQASAIRQDLLLAREELLTTATKLQQLEETRDIFHRTAESLLKLIPCEAISYYRIDWDNRMLQPVLSFGKDAENVMECGFSLDKGISGSIALTGQPEIVNDALSDPRAFHVPGTRDEVEAIMCLPLTDGERSIGVFCLYRLDGGIFTMEELETARLFSTQAEVAIRNAGLLKESKRRTHLLSTVLDLGRDINASLDIEEICKALYTKCSSVIDTSDFFIALLEEDFKTVNYIFLKDRDQTIHDLRLPFADTIAGYAIKSGQSVLLDEEILGSAARKFNRPYAPKSGIVTPLHAMNRIVGAVSVQSYEADVYDEESRLFLEILARQAGAALHNAYLYNKAVNAFKEIEKSQDEFIEAEKNRLRGEIGKNVAHEFNNLLATILGRTEVLLATTIDEKSRQQLETIHQSATSGAELVRHVTDIVPGEMQFDAYPIPLDVLLKSKLKSVDDDSSLDRWKFAEDAQFPLIYLPRSKAEVMVQHLVETITSAHPNGGIIHVSQVGSDSDKQTIRIDVRTPSPPDLPQSASLFRGVEKDQAKGARQARLILRELGGGLRYRESIHGDISFTLTLPNVGTPTTSCEKSKVLVVDDEDSVRDVLCDMVNLLGYSAFPASSGEDALTQLEMESFDIVVTDVGMPGMDGMALLDAIREKDSRTPVILVTGWGTGEYDRLLEADQHLWVLCKPIQVAQMQNSLQEAGSTLTASIESSMTPASPTQKDDTDTQENA